MKTKTYLKVLVLNLLILGITVSCERDNLATDDIQTNDVANEDLLEIDDLALTAKTSCKETKFPPLGPSAASAQTCTDRSNPLNIGRLDCRTKNTGGYSEITDGNKKYGEYTLRGGSQRYDGTRTRVERFFNPVTRRKGRYGNFTAKFVINDLSDGNTCIVQAHAGGKIVAGKRKGQDATSALVLLYAKKTSNSNTFALEIHESTTPYTTTNRGSRTKTFLRNIKRGQEYTMTFRSGYNSSNKAYTIIRIGGTSKKLNHTFTTEQVVTRYGAYETGDSGDTGARLRFRDTKFCRTN